ncbi:MAG: hypothetical protein JST16_15020 [Bdellovibrionales bacterium]|nr:hypothetical protein [Bdellovibrionales bacterium]
MIPLRATEPVQKFPWLALALALLWILADLATRVIAGGRGDWLVAHAFVPSALSRQMWGALVFHSTAFAAGVTAIYTWVFMPRLLERRSAIFALAVGLSGWILALYSYRALHPDSSAPVLAPEAILGAWLGAFMRRDIWGSVDTLVMGPRLFRVLEVPSYVLLFFWLFYLLMGNLFAGPPFSDAPMLYWIPFISFLWGFVLETLWEILGAWMSSSSNSAKYDANKS